MEYHYDYHNDRDGAQPPRQSNTPQRTPNPNGQSNDFGAWLLIGIMFLVAWPVGLILLIKKLTDNPKTKRAAANTAAQVRSRAQQTRTQAQQSAPQTAPSVQQARPAQPKKQSAVQKVTQTPQPSAGGAKALKIVGIVLAALGGAALLNVAANDLGYAIQYGEWWYFLRQLFYPVGLLSGGLSLLIGSAVMKRKMRRYAKYLACAGTRDTIPLAHLMKAAEVGEAKAERDLEAMVEKGMWGPDAYLDRGNDMLFRTQAAANAYFSAKRAGEQRQAAEEHRRHVEAVENLKQRAFADSAMQQWTFENDNGRNPQTGIARRYAEHWEEMQAEGYEGMLLAIRRANDRIDDEVLSAKIDRLETVTGQIFKVIQEQPAKKNQASTFLNYYLPTTQKLLDSYADFEEAGVSGQNLDQAKSRIADTMDNIIAGFEHQLDALYQDAAMDIDSDIRVMETMLRRDTATAADDFGLDGGTAVQMPDTEIE